MTNPTPPLTAEDLAKEISAYFGQHYAPWIAQELPPRLEAYAAQKNAELVADVKLLRKALSKINGQFSNDEKRIAEALAATDRPEYKEVE